MKKRPASKKKILLVEDEESIRVICQRVLASEGFDVDSVANGQAAKAKIEEEQYNLYIFDIKMPLMSGVELFKWMEKTCPESASKVVFITGSTMGDESERFFQQSGRPVLYKPFSIDELKWRVQACFNDAKKHKVRG